MRKTVASAILVLGFILLSLLNCYAESGIGGTYFLVGSRSCAYVNNYNQPFEPPYFVLPSDGTTRTGHYQGNLTLNADGTGTWQFHFTQYNHQLYHAGDSPIKGFSATSCDVVYEATPKGFRLRVLEGCSSEIVDGVGKGQVWITGEISLPFQASKDGGVLLLSNTKPRDETTWLENSPSLILHRVCSRTLMAVRQTIVEDEQ